MLLLPTTTSFPEVVWFLSALGGLTLTVWLILDATEDVQASNLSNGIRQIIARGRLQAESCRLLAQLILFLMAIRAADAPLGARLEPTHLTYLTLFRAEYVLSIVSVTMLLGSIISYRTKYLVRRAIRRETGANNAT